MTSFSSGPLVSIVTPVYNGAAFLEELIVSVEKQDYPAIEHIVIDDGSTDEQATTRILAKHPSVRWWSRENRGQYATINEGLMAASGELFATISADDFYAGPGAVRSAVECFLSHPGCSGVYGYTEYVDQFGTRLPVQPPRSLPLWVLPYYPFIAHCSLFVRRDLLMRDDMHFDQNLRFRGDYDWLMRLKEARYRFHCTGGTIACYRYNSLQTTSVRNLHAMEIETTPLKRRYAKSRIAEFSIQKAISWRHRILMARASYRAGGVRALGETVLDWIIRQSGYRRAARTADANFR